MKPAPIALFVYNRLKHTQETTNALAANFLAKDSDLFIFSDGPKNTGAEEKIKEVRQYLKTISGFKSVTIKEKQDNLGLAKSIISGVSEMTEKFGRVIVMEDDLVTSPFFLKYMNDGLAIYENDNQVASIHGYVFPAKNLPETFFMRGADCWGWATWKRAWDNFQPDGSKLLKELEKNKLTENFNLDGNFHYTEMLKRQIAGLNDSWAIRWHASTYLKNMLTLFPGKSLVSNIGQDASGTHGAKNNFYKSQMTDIEILVNRIKIEESAESRKKLIKYLRSLKPNIFARIYRKALKSIGKQS